MGGSGSFYGTGSALPAGNNQSMSAANLQSRSRMNPMLVNTNQLNIQSIQSQPQIKTEVLDQSEKMNFQSSQLAHEQLPRQNSMRQHQVQPFPICSKSVSSKPTTAKCTTSAVYAEKQFI
jgi:E1A/CREB-binding protein